MKIVEINGEDTSGSCLVVCVHKLNEFSGVTTKFFETFYFQNYDDLLLYLSFESCVNCKIKAYKILERFADKKYSGLEFRDAMKSRI